jgi:hypothetical protein
VPSDNHDSPDDALDANERAQVDALDTEAVAQIDALLLSNVRQHPRKVAMVVALAMDAVASELREIPGWYYGARIRGMVESGALASNGDLSQMRYSEVWLPGERA